MRWLVLHDDGQRQMLNLDKRQLIQARQLRARETCLTLSILAATPTPPQGFSLDIPIRDMRLLETSMSNYETIGQV